ncbi:hypothetical protein L1994_06575 [Methanomicrobium antiquum]|uniref:Uncharacterized protein n=1 Tax=Methanomicrobium antiquum TaxID=487686 RepID=A0AAF0FTV9_9EURY|nr:hypothetical protein [Methanomicrobium antiquum]WFN35825.1 hypothetical protein L1994_06575 [Methanomicrobium antiquum]
MKFDHKEIFILFIAVMAGYIARNIYSEFPYSLIIMVIAIIVVYYLLEYFLKKFHSTE